MLTIERTGEVFLDRKGVEGKRLWVTLGPLRVPAIERGEGYKWLRPGLYDCELGIWTSSKGTQARAIRVLGSYSRGRIYLHPANQPHQLSGCIALGLMMFPFGVLSSRTAVQRLINALGGWHEGFKFKMEVKGS